MPTQELVPPAVLFKQFHSCIAPSAGYIRDARTTSSISVLHAAFRPGRARRGPKKRKLEMKRFEVGSHRRAMPQGRVKIWVVASET